MTNHLDPLREFASLAEYRDMLLADGENVWHASTIAADLELVLQDLREERTAAVDERQRAYQDAVKVANAEKAKRLAAEDDMAAIAAARDAWGERAIRAEAALKVSDQQHRDCIDKLHALRADVATADATALRAPTRIYHLYLTRMGDVVMDSHLYDHPPEKWLHLGPIEVVETK